MWKTSIDSLKEKAKETSMPVETYPGVISQTRTIRIGFYYDGIRCRETLKIPPTPSNLKFAENKRNAILFEIETGQFDYLKHFPNSKKAKALAAKNGDYVTVGSALKAYLIRAQSRCEYTTIRDYNTSVYKYLIPEFGSLTLNELTPSQVKHWLAQLPLSNKRKNNILIPLRQMYQDAYYDETIDKNPLSRVKNLRVKQKEPIPFTLKEIKAILNQLVGQLRNLIQFAFWSGLRSSELIGLKWEDVDFEKKQVHIRRAVVRGRVKTTKTRAGLRTIELTEPAYQALKEQSSFTLNQSEWVFNDPKTNDRWKNDNPIRKRVWIPALKAAKVKYRNPYQTRHTFASMMLSQGKNPMWVAHQMGHSDWGMIRKVYGRWIPS